MNSAGCSASRSQRLKSACSDQRIGRWHPRLPPALLDPCRAAADKEQLLLENPTGHQILYHAHFSHLLRNAINHEIESAAPAHFEGRFAIQIAGGRRRLAAERYPGRDRYFPGRWTARGRESSNRGRQAHPRADRSGGHRFAAAVVPTLRLARKYEQRRAAGDARCRAGATLI